MGKNVTPHALKSHDNMRKPRFRWDKYKLNNLVRSMLSYKSVMKFDAQMTPQLQT